MTRLEDGPTIESIVGVRRHPTAHLAVARTADSRVYILHSAECIASTASGDLRDCDYSRTLDRGIDLEVWKNDLDRAVIIAHNPKTGRLVPFAQVDGHEWRDDLSPTASTCARCGATDDDEFPDQTPPQCHHTNEGAAR